MGTAHTYLDTLTLAKRAGLAGPAFVPRTFMTRVEKMFEYGAYVADPRGCLPR